ncbi:MAG: penicillin-binding protein activator LpoB [Magnetococcales bacterium]|nr:penicillin-binding protein activator LpoB [Magnetococcales bacterium]
MKNTSRLLLGLVAVVALSGCETMPTRVDNSPGTPTTYIDPGTAGPLAGVGIESQDIMAMTDKMVRGMLEIPQIAQAKAPPRIILDPAEFQNESSQAINKNHILERLKVDLNRSAKGRLMFIPRQNAAVVEKERQLKRAGKVDAGTTGLTKAAAGGDYLLKGKFTSQDQRTKDGRIQRSNTIFISLLDLELGAEIWSDYFDAAKYARDDVVYH